MPTLKLNSKHFAISEKNLATIPECANGNYAFGFINSSNRFVPKHIGRATSNLKEDIVAAIEAQQEQGKRYSHFKYKCAADSREAYEIACKNYHDFSYSKDGESRQLDNMSHPSGGSCPVENCYQ